MGAGGQGGFGPLLRSRRLSAGLTQEELAAAAGLSARTVGDLERGSTGRPYPKTVALLAAALGLDEAGRAELAELARAGDEAEPVLQVPRQLPAAVPDFVGRRPELGALSAPLLSAPLGGAGRAAGTVMVTAVGGLAGVGKTALAVRWAHQVAGQFPDGQLYVNLRGFGPGGPPLPPAVVIRDFLDALGVPAERIPVRPQAQAGLYRSLMAGRRMLVVLDNARDSEQVAGLLPGSSGCLALVTSRAPLTGLAAEGARVVALDVLSGGEARDLLGLRLGWGRVAAEPEAVAQIVALTGRLPLALSIVAARAAGHPGYRLAALAGELADARGRLDALGGGEVSADVRAAFSWSFEQLSPAAAGMFGLLGVHPGPEVSVVAAASLAAVGVGAARRALGELTAAGLLSEPQAGRYACHDLVRAYAVEVGAARPGGPGALLAATRRMLDHYLHTALAARQHINQLTFPLALVDPQPGVRPEPIASHAEAMDWFTAECPVLLALLSVAMSSGLDVYAQQLPLAISFYLQITGRWQEWIEALQVSLAAAQRRGDVDGQGWAQRFIGVAFTQLGRLDEAPAHLHEALAMFKLAEDDLGQGSAHTALAGHFVEQRQFSQAAEHARLGLDAYLRAGDRNGQAMTLNVLAMALSELGDDEEALGCGLRALGLSEETGNRVLAANIRDTIGLVHHHQGQQDQAIAWYEQSIAECRELGDRWGEAGALMHLGDAWHAAGDASQARQAWQQALTVFDELSHPGAAELRARLQ
jgi:tetratricopeptide (TPR) repeat protein/transcriptional regulator with XRE-family HTH domain